MSIPVCNPILRLQQSLQTLLHHGPFYNVTHGGLRNCINRKRKKIVNFIKISKKLSAIVVILLTVNKIASSGDFSPLYRSFPL